MKLTLIALLAGCLAVTCTSADTDYDYEEEAAAAPLAPAAPTPAKQAPPAAAPKANKLGSLLSPRRGVSGPLAARKSPVPVAATTANTKSTTTTEQPAEQYEEEYDEAEEESAKQDVPTTTTTEPPKKLGRGGVVRPFRSNEDLLAALKRRRAQGFTPSHPRETSTTQSTAETTPSKSKSQSNAGRLKAANANEVPKSTNRVRFGGVRGKTATNNQEEAQETQSENVQVKPKAYRRG